MNQAKKNLLVIIVVLTISSCGPFYFTPSPYNLSAVILGILVGGSVFLSFGNYLTEKLLVSSTSEFSNDFFIAIFLGLPLVMWPVAFGIYTGIDIIYENLLFLSVMLLIISILWFMRIICKKQ